MRRATFALAVALMAGFLASEAMADHFGPVHRGASITTVAHHGPHGHHGYHGYHGHPGHYRHHGGYYHPPRGYYQFRHPAIVRPYGYGCTPPFPGPRPPHVRRYDPHPFNSFYYRGRNIGIGIRF